MKKENRKEEKTWVNNQPQYAKCLDDEMKEADERRQANAT